jgi:hypothetical protein
MSTSADLAIVAGLLVAALLLLNQRINYMRTRIETLEEHVRQARNRICELREREAEREKENSR